ncbi:MAG: threonine/serine exporter family protein [Deltaproteobacteria bacterium]|nr:threonine/serine exporter family protein [Deltaproteobacteria bacterium]
MTDLTAPGSTAASQGPPAGPAERCVELAEYLTSLGGTLLSYGCPTHRLESLLREVATLEGHDAEVFAVPTGLWLMLRPRAPSSAEPVVRLVRVKEWAVDLDRLTAVDRIFNDALERKLTLHEATLAMAEIDRRPRPWPRWAMWAATPLATGTTAVFFRGGLAEIVAAAFGGVLLVLIGNLLRQRADAPLLADFAGGFVAGAVAWGASSVVPSVSREVLVLSIIIALVPGMALTTGLAELASKNLVSGSSRLMGAMIVFLSIVFGIAAAVAVEQVVGGGSTVAPLRPEPPLWLEGGALVLAALSFAIFFSAPRQYLLASMAAGGIAWLVTGLATRHLPSGLAPFLAAFSVAAFANLCARTTERPAQVFLLPGLVLLVPGSFGFLSLEAFLRGAFLDGAAKGFEMFLISGAIVTGLLLANVLVPARKFL